MCNKKLNNESYDSEKIQDKIFNFQENQKLKDKLCIRNDKIEIFKEG